MTTLYGKSWKPHTLILLIETLGVTNAATEEEIQAAYNKLKDYFHPSKTSDPVLGIYFNDMTL